MRLHRMLGIAVAVLALTAAVVQASELVPMKSLTDKEPSEFGGVEALGFLDCSGAIEVEIGTTYYGTNVGAPNNVSFYSCSTWNESGGEVVYHVFFPEGVVWEVNLLPTDCDLDLAVLDQCDEDLGCLGVFDNGVLVTQPLPGEFYFVVDGYNGAACEFEITFMTAPYVPPSGEIPDFCESVVDEDGNYFTGNTCDGANNVFEIGDCGSYPENGLEHYYEVVMPAGSLFAAYVTSTADGALWLLDDCAGLVSCLGYRDAAGSGQTEVLGYHNYSSEEITVFLVIDAYGIDACGDYTFEFSPEGGAVATDVENLGSVKAMFR